MHKMIKKSEFGEITVYTIMFTTNVQIYTRSKELIKNPNLEKEISSKLLKKARWMNNKINKIIGECNIEKN